MGGRIGCTSQIGKGSDFFLIVPFGIRTDEVNSEDSEPVALVIPPVVFLELEVAARILVVEDSEFNVTLVKAYLKDSGYELAIAENGKVGVEKTMSWNPHLILMDLLMPVMDGLEATRAIRLWEAKTHARPVPILALTAHATGEGPGGSLEAGCNEHLTKPINKATLLGAISRHLGRTKNFPAPNKIAALSLTAPRTVNLEQLIEQMDGDAGLFRKMAALFLAEAPKKMEGIRIAVELGDAGSLLKLSHALKGSAANFFAESTTAALARLETMARKADLTEAPPAYSELSTQIEKLNRELTHLVTSDVLGCVREGEHASR
jgi:CheY-like chemotaxis protein/HPt (histidine-containing phosphotransfer) domain-containing protein